MLGKMAWDDLNNYAKDLDKVVSYVPDNKNGGVKPIRKRDKSVIKDNQDKHKVMYIPRELRSEQEEKFKLTESKISDTSKDELKQLVKYYNKKENREKLLNFLKNKEQKYRDWIKSLESQIPDKYLNAIKSKIDEKYANDLKEWSITGLLKDAFIYTKEALWPDWMHSKKGIGRIILDRFIVYKLVGIVASINYMMRLKLNNLAGTKLGGVLTGVIVAPIVEELYKYLSIKLGEKEWGWFVFNVKEFSIYVKSYGGINFKNIPYTVLRLICVLEHLLYTKTLDDKELPRGLSVLFHSFNNGPMLWIVGIVSLLGESYFGSWGEWFATVGTMFFGIKFMLNYILELKNEK